MRDAAGIDPRGLIVFVDERLEIAQRAVGFGAGHGGREVIDDHGLCPALCLGSLARIVDDEGIEMRHRSEDRFGEALRRQRDGLARQPLEIAVFPEVNDRLRPKRDPEPGVKGKIVMRRNEIRGVIGGLWVDVVAAGRLHTQNDVSVAQDRQGERPVNNERVGHGRSPARLDRLANALRQGIEKGGVGLESQAHSPGATGPVGQPVRRALEDRIHQRRAVAWRAVDAVAGGAHRIEDRDRRRRRVETDTVGKASVLVGIVRQHKRHAPRAAIRACQGDPCRSEIGRERDPVVAGAVGGDGAFGGVVAPGIALEADGAGQDPAIDFRQRHVHGDIARRQAAVSVLPRDLGAGRKHDLDHRPAERVEDGRFTVPTPGSRVRGRDGEACGVQDEIRRGSAEYPCERRGGNAVLERGDEDRQRVESAHPQRGNEPVHGLQPRALHERSVEDHGHHRGAGGPVSGDRIGIGHRRARPVIAGSQQRPRRLRARLAAEHVVRETQKCRGVLRAALDAAREEVFPIRAVHAGQVSQVDIRLVIAGEQGERNACFGEPDRELLDAVPPVGSTAEQADDHQFRAPRGLFEIEIDCIGVREPAQMGQPQIRRGRSQGRPRGGEQRELGVGRRDENDIGGCLGRIDRLAPVGNRAGACRQQMHLTRPRQPGFPG